MVAAAAAAANAPVTDMKGMLQAIGLSSDAADYMINEQAIKDLKTLRKLSDTNISDLCKTCRKYGEKPGVAAATRANSSPGIPIPNIHEQNMQLAAFYLRFKEMTSRTVEFADLTSDTVNELADFKTEIESMVDPPIEQAPPFNKTKLFEFFDSFGTFLNLHIGSVSKRPLGLS